MDPEDKSISAYATRFKNIFLRGLSHDVHDDDVKDDAMVVSMHDAAEAFAPETETVFKYLQVLSACAVSFAHGESPSS